MAPHSMSDSDMVRPMPRAAPVTMMIFPARLKRPGTLLSWPALAWISSWTWALAWTFAAGASGVVAGDEVFEIGDSLVAVCPVEASGTFEAVDAGLEASSVWDS